MRINRPSFDQTLPWGIALLRVVVGFIFIMHGQQKLLDTGLGGVTGFFGSLGIPAPGLAAIAVSLLEIVGGLALIAGIFTRVVGVLLAVEMLAAMLLVHRANGFFATTGGIEFVFVLGVAALALALTGPGAVALDQLLPSEHRGPSPRRSDLAPGRG